MSAEKQPASFVCPRCRAESHHPQDFAEGYCGKCHDWTRPAPVVEDALSRLARWCDRFVGLAVAKELECFRAWQEANRPILKVVRLEDGRFGVENGEGVAELTRKDLAAMAGALGLWFDLHTDVIEAREKGSQ